MRINKLLAQLTGMSRRHADNTVAAGRVTVNGSRAILGQDVTESDVIQLDGGSVMQTAGSKEHVTIMLNKPVGYVVSRNGQGSKTIYDLLPAAYRGLKPIGRLDKNSSGLLLLTNDGRLAHDLTHPGKQKLKVYEVALNKPLTAHDWELLTQQGVKLADGLSRFDELRWLERNDGYRWMIVMHEGRNRQIRRTFEALGYTVTNLHRTHFGPYSLQHATRLGSYSLI